MDPVDRDFARASDALIPDTLNGLIAVLGAGYAGASISGGSFHLGPTAVREALDACSTGRAGLGIGDHKLLDAGDVDLAGLTPEAMQSKLASVVARVGPPMVVLGGDDSITVGVARGVGADALLTFDAHHDCRDPSTKITNGSPVRQLLEAKDVGTVVQIGIAPFSNGMANRLWAEERGVTIIETSGVHREGIDAALERAMVSFTDARTIVVDLDLDVLDRAFVPAAPAAMPGGLLPHMIFEAMQRLGNDQRVAALVITEHDPARDLNQQTARIAALSLMHFAAGVAGRKLRVT